MTKFCAQGDPIYNKEINISPFLDPRLSIFEKGILISLLALTDDDQTIPIDYFLERIKSKYPSIICHDIEAAIAHLFNLNYLCTAGE